MTDIGFSEPKMNFMAVTKLVSKNWHNIIQNYKHPNILKDNLITFLSIAFMFSIIYKRLGYIRYYNIIPQKSFQQIHVHNHSTVLAK